MADNDQSLYNIRYNQVTQGMEGFGGGTPQWTPLVLTADGGINQLTGDVTAGPGVGSQVATVAPTAAVKTLHADSHANLTGNVQLVSGTNITLSQVGQAITINSTGGGGGATVSPYTPTITGAGTPTSVAFFYKTDGVSVDVWGTFTSGTSTATPISISVPVTIFTSHLPSGGALVGSIRTDEAGSNIFVSFDGSTNSAVFVGNADTGTGNLFNKVNGTTLFNPGDLCSVHFSYPIA